jgi:hypothetical protein
MSLILCIKSFEPSNQDVFVPPPSLIILGILILYADFNIQCRVINSIKDNIYMIAWYQQTQLLTPMLTSIYKDSWTPSSF